MKIDMVCLIFADHEVAVGRVEVIPVEMMNDRARRKMFSEGLLCRQDVRQNILACVSTRMTGAVDQRSAIFPDRHAAAPVRIGCTRQSDSERT